MTLFGDAAVPEEVLRGHVFFGGVLTVCTNGRNLATRFLGSSGPL